MTLSPRSILLLPLFAWLLCPPALAQRSFPGHRVASAPVIDGKIEAEEWKDIPTVSGGYDEATGAPAPETQQFWFGYDDKFLYFAARLGDHEPEKIKATETRMNVNIQSDDHVILAIDPFNNLQNLNQFRINANGAAQLQIAGGRAPKREWVGEILSRGRVTAEGWECEARIPWALMQLPPPGKRTIRADFGRSLARNGRGYIASNIAGEQLQNIIQWTGVDVPRILAKKVLKLLPYGYAGFDKSDASFASGGLDLKTSLTEGLELVGTVSPDFRNIENDVLSLDFSYFERLAGESRPFFIEGQQFFSTSMDAPIFASQRIRNFDTGLKLYGKLNDQTRLAFLNLVDFNNFNASAANVEVQLGLRETLKVAGSYLDRSGNTNSASFLSYNKSLGNMSYFGHLSTTADDEVDGGHRYNTGFVYQKDGINAFMEYQEISPDFLPRLGFAPQRDYKGFAGNFNWRKPHKHAQIMETEFNFGGSHQDNFAGDPFRRSINGSMSVTLRDQTDFDFSANYEEIQGFKDHLFFVSLERPRNDPYRRWQIDYAWGNVAGETLSLLSPSFSYRPTKNFQVNLRHEHFEHIENSNQTILSMNYEVNRFDSVSGRVLRRDDDTNFYLAWRRAGNRGTEYYVILGDPNARRFQSSIIVKAVMPIEVVLGKR